MERLLADAEKISGIHYDISSLADVYNAIHVIQEEMGIAGTTSEEAASTIEGSTKSLAAAWENLVAGFAKDGSDMDTLINNVVNNATTAFENMLPVAERALTGVGDFVAKIAPIIGSKLPELINTIVPTAVEAGTTFITTLLKSMQDNAGTLVSSAVTITNMLIQAFIQSLPLVVGLGAQILTNLIQGIVEAMPELLPQLVELLNTVIPTIIDSTLTIITALLTGFTDNLPVLLDGLLVLFDTVSQSFIDNLPTIIALGLQLITSLATGIAEALPDLIPKIVDIVLAIATTLTEPTNLSNILNAGIQLLLGLLDGIINAMPQLLEQMPQIIINIVTALIEAAPKLIEAATEIISKFTAFLLEPGVLETLVKGTVDIVMALVNALIDNAPKLLTAATELISSLVVHLGTLLWKIAEFGVELVDKFGKSLSSGEALDKLETAIGDFILDLSEKWGKLILKGKEWGEDLIENFKNGIKEKFSDLKEQLQDVAQGIKDYLGFSEPKKGPLSNFHTYAPDMMDLFAQGIKDNEGVVLGQISKSFDFDGLVGGLNDEVQLSAAMVNTTSKAAAGASNAGNVQPVNRFYIDGRELAKVITPYLTAEQQRLGVNIAKGAL